MSKNDNTPASIRGSALASFESAAAIVDDWENIGNEQVQQLTNERLNFAEQQKQTNVVEQKLMKEDNDEIGLPASMVNKPIKILRREQPARKQRNDSEGGDEAALLDKISLDERKANYDKIRERIFNAANLEETSNSGADNIFPKKPNEPEASTSSEIVVETINHLSNIQMLSEQTRHPIRQPPVVPPQAPSQWCPPQVQDFNAFPPINFGAPNVRQPPMPIYGIPPPQPIRFVPPIVHPPDFSRPPPMAPNLNLSSRNKFNP